MEQRTFEMDRETADKIGLKLDLLRKEIDIDIYDFTAYIKILSDIMCTNLGILVEKIELPDKKILN